MSQSNTIPAESTHYISLSTAVDMTETYRDKREKILATSYQNQDILPLSETFNKDAFTKLIDTENSEGIRLYYGMDENLQVHAIFVAVNDKNEDILPDSSTSSTTTNAAVILEAGQRCPTICPPSSVLN